MSKRLTAEDIAKGALRIDWRNTESQARSVAYHAEDLLAGTGFNLVAHIGRQRAFSERTWGPGARTQMVADHIRKELIEIEAKPDDIAEWADVILLAFDGAWRSGATPAQIIEAIEAKQTKNEGRVWPDWRTQDPNKAIEHDRSLDEEPPSVSGWVFGALRTAHSNIEAVCMKHGCEQGEDMVEFLDRELAKRLPPEVPPPRHIEAAHRPHIQALLATDSDMPVPDLMSALACAAGLLRGAGHKGSAHAVLQAYTLLQRAGDDLEQHIERIEGVVESSGTALPYIALPAIKAAIASSYAAGIETERARGDDHHRHRAVAIARSKALDDATDAYLAGYQGKPFMSPSPQLERMWMLGIDSKRNDARLDHIEQNWFDVDPGVPEIRWAFDEVWAYQGTAMLRQAVDNEIRLKRANEADTNDVGEPVESAALPVREVRDAV